MPRRFPYYFADLRWTRTSRRFGKPFDVIRVSSRSGERGIPTDAAAPSDLFTFLPRQDTRSNVCRRNRPFGKISGRSQRRNLGAGAFSLVEVMIAVGIFAVAVVAVLGLLPSLARSGAESADALVAQRLPAALESELRRSAAQTDLDSLASSIPMGTTPLGSGIVFVGSHDGVRLVPLAESTSMVAAGDGYFAVEVWRFPSEPLGFVAGDAVLALRARVSWPYRLPGAAVATPISERSQFSFDLAINR